MRESERKRAIAGLGMAFISVFIPLFHFILAAMALYTVKDIHTKPLRLYVRTTKWMSYLTIGMSVVECLYWVYVLFIH
ncbi:hypothetical protein [Listeria ilorinensis]|uniref:hypothetical protein n=1 Tax=Listeria ilorinensis TaxID=2867439 RepID=UPI001EF68C5C|nr:hypothetical protein [Listeria ilorinensis]